MSLSHHTEALLPLRSAGQLCGGLKRLRPRREAGARRCALGDHEMLLAEKKENQLFNQMLLIDWFLSIVCVCVCHFKKKEILNLDKLACFCLVVAVVVVVVVVQDFDHGLHF